MREFIPYDGKSARVKYYFEKLTNFIPAETIAFYALLKSIIIQHVNNPQTITVEFASWFILVAGWLGTICYLNIVVKIHNKRHIFISSLSFIIWALSLNGPPLIFIPANEADKTMWMSIVLFVYTFSLGFIPDNWLIRE